MNCYKGGPNALQCWLLKPACSVTITLLGPLHQMTATIQSAVVTMSARIVTEYIYSSRAAAATTPRHR